MKKSDFVFFWGSADCYSQWHKSEMIIEGKKFNCCEQWMMYNKAVLFNDLDTANKIMSTENPKVQKQLGRQVKNFNAKVWDEQCREIVYQGNLAKFSQNKELRQKLLDTGNKEIAEASPYDKIWGIGMLENDIRATYKSQWLGTNWLGEAIMRVRDELRRQVTD